jgi:hypothetical protein
MKNIIRLTENDIARLVKKTISEGKKYEYMDEHPSYKELNTKIKELKKIMKTISKDLEGDDTYDYVMEYVQEKL